MSKHAAATFANALRKAGVDNPVVVLDNGEDAVEYLAGAGPHAGRSLPALVLLDLKLPRRSGFEVLEWLGAQPGHRRQNLVVLKS